MLNKKEKVLYIQENNLLICFRSLCIERLTVLDDGLHVRLRPFGQLGNERHERAAYFRQAVLDLRRHGKIYFAQAFAGAMKKAYPDLPGADGLEDLAKALYK